MGARTPTADKMTRSSSVLAANLKALMQANEALNSNPKLDAKTKLGTSAISRILNGHNATVSTVDRLADAFGVDPWLLLMPGLDPKNLPAIQPVSEREAALYKRLKDLAREFNVETP